MSSDGIVLDDNEKFLLAKFRQNVADVSPRQDNDYLRKWLSARLWDLTAAEKMLREHVQWRNEWKVDGELKTWKAPEVLQRYFLGELVGEDKDGAPVGLMSIATMDMPGLVLSASTENITKMFIQMYESFLQRAAQNGKDYITFIIDCDEFELKPYIWKPVIDLIISLLKIYEANWPGTLNYGFLVNAPTVFVIFFNMIKPFIHEETVKRIYIFRNEPEIWKAALLDQITPENLPKFYGGKLTDPDGNPKCLTRMVCAGGKIPKYLYLNSDNSNEKNIEKYISKHYTSAVVKHGKKLKLDFKVAEQGCYLKWDFHTEDYDIKFAVICRDRKGTISEAVKTKRVNAHKEDETGLLHCQAPATYTVIFDNSYSVMRNKNLFYEVFLTPPTHQTNA